MMIDSYVYDDPGYLYAGIHRQLLVYDPLSTDNPVIIEYFNESRMIDNDYATYLKIIDAELNQHRMHTPPVLPISFVMAWHEMTLSWVEIIQHMIFRENSFATFHAEFYQAIEMIIKMSDPTIKESIVFRFPNTGESVFHVAAKKWLSKKSLECNDVVILNRELIYLMNCYKSLALYLGEDRELDIIHMVDFSGCTLFDDVVKHLDRLF